MAAAVGCRCPHRVRTALAGLCPTVEWVVPAGRRGADAGASLRNRPPRLGHRLGCVRYRPGARRLPHRRRHHHHRAAGARPAATGRVPARHDRAERTGHRVGQTAGGATAAGNQVGRRIRNLISLRARTRHHGLCTGITHGVHTESGCRVASLARRARRRADSADRHQQSPTQRAQPSDVLAGWALGYAYFIVCLLALPPWTVTAADGTPPAPGNAP